MKQPEQTYNYCTKERTQKIRHMTVLILLKKKQGYKINDVIFNFDMDAI